MNAAESSRATIREYVSSRYPGTFLTADLFFEDREAVLRELGKLAEEEVVARVHRGVYWKLADLQRGEPRSPRPMALGLFIAGDGAGPAGVSAANLIGTSGREPEICEIAVSGRDLTAPMGVKFVRRSNTRALRMMNHTEVALLEVLGDWPKTSDGSWAELVDKVGQLVDVGAVRLRKMNEEVHHFPAPMLNQRWDSITALV